MIQKHTSGDVNIRITREARKLLKIRALEYGISLKEIVGILALSKFPIKIK